jgi:hypothetical protein
MKLKLEIELKLRQIEKLEQTELKLHNNDINKIKSKENSLLFILSALHLKMIKIYSYSL